MHPSRVPIDPELLRRLYVDEGLSTPEIAAKLGCADVTILRRLRRLGIDVRPRGPVPVSRAEAIGIDWSPKLCYALGLMATDGNLSRRKGQMSLVSKDLEQIETLRRCLQLVARISKVRSSTGVLHKVQWCDRGLYNWFLGVGLTPAKSLTLGPRAVPDEHFADFFRGCVDGDGCVLSHDEEQAVYLRAPLRVAGLGESSVSRVDSGEHPQACRGLWSHPHSWREPPTADLGSSLRQGGVYTAALLDVLRTGCSLPRPQAGQSRKIPFFSRATPSRVAVHCGTRRHRRGSGPEWCNGSHAGLKIQCPQGRAGSNPASGTIP